MEFVDVCFNDMNCVINDVVKNVYVGIVVVMVMLNMMLLVLGKMVVVVGIVNFKNGLVIVVGVIYCLCNGKWLVNGVVLFMLVGDVGVCV